MTVLWAKSYAKSGMDDLFFFYRVRYDRAARESAATVGIARNPAEVLVPSLT